MGALFGFWASFGSNGLYEAHMKKGLAKCQPFVVSVRRRLSI